MPTFDDAVQAAAREAANLVVHERKRRLERLIPEDRLAVAKNLLGEGSLDMVVQKAQEFKDEIMVALSELESARAYKAQIDR